MLRSRLATAVLVRKVVGVRASRVARAVPEYRVVGRQTVAAEYRVLGRRLGTVVRESRVVGVRRRARAEYSLVGVGDAPRPEVAE